MNVNVSQEEVEHVAELARLQLTREESERFALQLSRILKYVEELNAVDTTGVRPTTSVAADAGALRADTVHPSLSQERALRNAPEAVDGFFHVPHVLGTVVPTNAGIKKGEP